MYIVGYPKLKHHAYPWHNPHYEVSDYPDITQTLTKESSRGKLNFNGPMGHFIMVKSLGKNHTQLVDGFYI